MYPEWCITAEQRARWDAMTPAQRAFRVKAGRLFERSKKLKWEQRQSHRRKDTDRHREDYRDPTYRASVLAYQKKWRERAGESGGGPVGRLGSSAGQGVKACPTPPDERHMIPPPLK